MLLSFCVWFFQPFVVGRSAGYEDEDEVLNLGKLRTNFFSITLDGCIARALGCSSSLITRSG